MRRFFADNAVLGAATVVAGLFNYLYHVVLAHVLGPGRYGDLTTFLNITFLLVLPAPVVTLIYTRVGQRPERRVVESWWLWTGGVVLWGALWAASAPLAHAFRVNRLLLAIFTFEAVPSLALAANAGMLQRARRFGWVGVLDVLNNGFRVLAAAAAAWSPYRMTAVGILEGVAVWATWGVSRALVRRMPPEGERPGSRLVAGTAAVGVLNVMLAAGDGLAAKLTMPGVEAGLYNGLATIGHSLQFISGSLGTVMLTAIVADPERRWRFLGMTAAVYGVLAGAVQWVFWNYPGWLIRGVLGPHFSPDAPFMAYYGWGMMALGLLNIAMLYSVADRHWSVVAAAGAGTGYWLWALFGQRTVADMVRTTTHILLVMAVVTAAVMAGTAGLSGLRARPSRDGGR